MNLSDKFRALRPMVKDFNKFIEKEIETVLKVNSKKLLETKDQKKFLLMTLGDRSGNVRAVDWYNPEANNKKVSVGDVVKVKGKVVVFEDRIQINIAKDDGAISVLSDGQFPTDRFVGISDKNPNELFTEVLGLVKKINDKDIRDLTEKIFISLEKIVKRSPAGVRVHHAYIGGLLEHSLTVGRIAEYVAGIYGLNKDLMIAGALLHDIGKTLEYKVTPSGIEVTTEGELKGHIIMGIEIVREYAKKLQTPKDKLTELEHIIASHHGEMELGSPVLPKTPEALAIHFIENMDSKLARFKDIAKATDSGKNWSDFDKNLGRRIFLRNGDRID